MWRKPQENNYAGFSFNKAGGLQSSKGDFDADLLNGSNISLNITKMPCWMKCWIGLTEHKNSKKRKNHVQ